MDGTPRVEDWFRRWLLGTHIRQNPHEAWKQDQYNIHTDEGRLFFRGWVRAFKARGVTEPIAARASEQLMRIKAGYPEHHLSRLLAIADELAHEQRIEADRQARAEERHRAAQQRIRHERLKARWEGLSEPRKEKIRRETREMNPTLSTVASAIEYLAIESMDQPKADKARKKVHNAV